MKIVVDCIPCLAKQALTALKMLDIPEQQRLEILREVLKFSTTVELGDFPPAIPSDYMHRMIRKLTGNADPFKEIKKEYNESALKLEPLLWRMIEKAQDPIYTAIHISITGNIIDFGVHHKKFDLREKLDVLIQKPLAIDAYSKFKEEFNSKEGVFIILDNAGEIVFDKQMARLFTSLGKEVVCAVKGGPVINDATIEDANEVELNRFCKVVTNGNDHVGTLLDKCSEEFLRYFNNDDFLVISKGQANFETLNTVNRKIFFLLQAKCEVLTHFFNTPFGALIFYCNK